jgi:hypothetical protein
MRYTVVWKRFAEAQLADIWNNSDDRSAVTAAANAIDQTLKIDPVLRGEIDSGAVRVFIQRPLLVRYLVIEGDRIVRILTVQLMSADDPRE